MKNLMDIYINYTIKCIKNYMREIFNTSYDAKIVQEYIQTYVNVRYYNVCTIENTKRPFFLRIMDELNIKEQKLMKIYGAEKEKIITNVKKAFSYILFFDNVRKVENFKNIESIKEVIKELVAMREKEFGIPSVPEFEKNLYKRIIDDMLKKDVFLDKFMTDEFNINVQNTNSSYIYLAKLEHNLIMPRQYSEFAINKVYNSGVIGEDKLEIEYMLLSVIAIRDIINGRFKDTYIAEFQTTLFKKEKKLNKILSVLDNQELQEKITLNIQYSEFSTNKAKIFEFVKRGYKFTITLDNSLRDVNEIQKLRMFKFLILPKDLNLYKEIKKQKTLVNNIIEI